MDSVAPDQTAPDLGPDCLYAKFSPQRKHLHGADDFSRRYFQMLFFVGGEGLKQSFTDFNIKNHLVEEKLKKTLHFYHKIKVKFIWHMKLSIFFYFH